MRFRIALIAIASVAVFGCAKDADPNAKIDAPGYYNGEMKAKGEGAESPKQGEGQTKADLE